MNWTPRRLAMDALTALLAVCGVVFVVVGGGAPPESPRRAADGGDAIPGPPATAPPARTATTGAPDSGTGPGRGTAAPLGPSEPVALDIPAIGVSTALMSLGLNPDGTVAVPPLRRGAPAGWYRNLASPGEVGPAVILGHVDTAVAGPAVFFRLRELRAGDTATVRRRDGTAAVFTVSAVVEYPKSAFPTDAVYGRTDSPVLRLVTCGGSFDPVRRQYRGNVVVFAALTAAPRA